MQGSVKMPCYGKYHCPFVVSVKMEHFLKRMGLIGKKR